MTNLDQFESVFKSADKPVFAHERVEFKRVLIVTDLDSESVQGFATTVRDFLNVLDIDSIEFKTATASEFSRVGQLLQLVGQHNPDLICTYRNLHIPATDYPYSLGVYIDVLTQATAIPVMLLPHPTVVPKCEEVLKATHTVMAVTDHLTGDHRLVSFAVSLVAPGGKLLLTHVEDETVFEKYLTTISKIPEIDTETARDEIHEQLLKEPRDYIRSCREVLKADGIDVPIEEIVTVGHRLADYRKLIDEHDVNLVVLNTKDHGQLAMHGVAYPLSVELRETPMLLL